MALEESIITILKEFGFPVVAFILMYYMFKKQQEKMYEQADKIHEQADKMLSFAEQTINQNTIALTKLYEGLTGHIKQKDDLKISIEHCKRERNDYFDRLLRKKG